MNAPAESKLMRATVRGRVDSSRVHEKKRYTRILTPAPDPYSRPQVLEVRSDAPIGARGDEVTVVVGLGGFSGPARKVADPETGEIVMRTFVTHVLDLVE